MTSSNGAAYERVVDALRAHGSHLTTSGSGTVAQCPAHDDRRPSLSVDRASKFEGAVVTCRSGGCRTDDVMSALGLTVADLFDTPRERSAGYVVIAEYPYTDEHGTVLFKQERRFPKDFRVKRPDGSGGWNYKLGDTRRVLYRLPEVLAAVQAGQHIFIVEGEKDAERLIAAGHIATTNPLGAGKWRPTYGDTLIGAHVTIVADRDTAGRKHAQTVAADLARKAASVRIVEPIEGKDVSDHLAAGHNLDELLPIEQTAEPTPEHDEPHLEPIDPEPDEAPARPPALTFETIIELRARVAAAGPRRWLIRGTWPAAAYGVHAAEMKAQKTWNATDMAVAVAAGTPWLGHFPVDDPGPVLIFAGEGGAASILRRIDAVAAHYETKADDLHIAVCARAPHLSDNGHMGLFNDALDHYRPRLVVLDPLYLAARGAKLGDLYSMGELLETPQHMCSDADASLLVVHHYNRNKEAKGGASRMSGAGPAEWGRVLIGATVVSRHTDPLTRETDVLSDIDVIGGEVPDSAFRVRRKVRAEDPDDLDSELHYSVEVTFDVTTDATPGDSTPPAMRKLLEALNAIAHTEPQPPGALVDWISKRHGHGLTRSTVSRNLNELAERKLADSVDLGGREHTRLWFVPTPGEPK